MLSELCLRRDHLGGGKVSRDCCCAALGDPHADACSWCWRDLCARPCALAAARRSWLESAAGRRQRMGRRGIALDWVWPRTSFLRRKRTQLLLAQRSFLGEVGT